MQRARCCAANAYDATAAFHAVFGRASTPRHLRRLSSACNELRSQNHRGRRSYSTDTEDARQKDLAASTAETPTPADSRARKLAFYEELMTKETITRPERHAPKPTCNDELEKDETATHQRHRHSREPYITKELKIWKDEITSPERRTRKPASDDKLERDETTGRERGPEDEPNKRSSPPEEEQVDARGPWDARPGLSPLGEPLWKTKMVALSRHIRESRLSESQDTPEVKDNAKISTTLDYQGIAIRPALSEAYPPQPPPWATVCDEKTVGYTAAQILDAEIEAFAKYMSPTEDEQAARFAVRSDIRNIVQHDPDNNSVNNYHFGSTRTGLALPFSDIDLGVYRSDYPRDTLEQYMERLYQKLLHNKSYMLVVHRPPPNAIVTAQHKATGIDVQVIAKGVRGKQDKFVELYMERIPNFRELYAVVRTAFGTRGLVDPWIGGISAYGTAIMLVAAINRRGSPSDIRKSKSVSAQLLYFLNFWATFDTTKQGISFISRLTANVFYKTPADTSPADKEARLEKITTARDKGNHLKAGQLRIGRLHPEQPYLLCLQDPSTPINDLGSRCHAIKHIQATIKAMHADLLSAMQAYDTPSPDRNPKPDGSPRPSLLLPLAGPCHELYAERRARMVTGAKTHLALLMEKHSVAKEKEKAKEKEPPRMSLSRQKFYQRIAKKKASGIAKAEARKEARRNAAGGEQAFKKQDGETPSQD